jgi:hypothetical protein
MSGKFVGPMPLNEFLHEFLPPADGFSFSQAAKKKFDIVNKCKSEVEMYNPLVCRYLDFRSSSYLNHFIARLTLCKSFVLPSNSSTLTLVRTKTQAHAIISPTFLRTHRPVVTSETRTFP